MSLVNRRRREDQSVEELVRHAARLGLALGLVLGLFLFGLLFLSFTAQAQRPAPRHRPCITHRHRHRHHDHARRLRGRCAGAETMSLGAGARGYPDWQRVQNWDGPLVFSQSGVNHKGRFQTPIVEVSRFAAIEGRVKAFIAPVLLTLEWFAGPTEETLTGQRQLVLTPEISEWAQLQIRNLGPWVRATFAPVDVAVEWQLGLQLVCTNRAYPLELVPRQSVLVNTSHAFAEAGSVTAYPTDYFAGPIRVEAINFNAAGPLEVVLEAAVAPEEYVEVDRTIITAAQVVLSASFVAPVGAWRVLIRAAGKAETTVKVTPSVTGST